MDDVGDILDDLQADMAPPDASSLSAKQLVEELTQRGVKPTGFPEDDIKLLQKRLNAEFEADKEARLKERKDALMRRRAEEDALRMQRFLEKQKREEEEALTLDPQMSFFVELLNTNKTPANFCLRASPVAIRAFLKAIAASGNTSLKGLDLCGCSLGDDVGVEVGACLKTNKSLMRLDLDHNFLGPKSLASIAVGLQHNASLQALSLEHNPLTGGGGSGSSNNNGGTNASSSISNADANVPDLTGVAALAEALKVNTALLSLNLFQTGLTLHGGKLLVEGIVTSNKASSSSTSAATTTTTSGGGNTVKGLRVLQLGGYDGLDFKDHARIAETLRSTGAANAASISIAKVERAETRKMIVETEDAKVSASGAEAEVAWIENEKAQRKSVRDAADFDRYRKERMAELDREVAEKARKIRLAEEALAKEKKAKKK